MASSNDSPATGPEPIQPEGDRQLERIQPDQALTVRLQPVDGGDAHSAQVRDLSLHGLLVTSVPALAQDTMVDVIDLEPHPVRARVVRQSKLGTHVTFIEHLHPRYRAGAPGEAGARGLGGMIGGLLTRLGLKKG